MNTTTQGAGPRVTEEDVAASIKSEHYFTAADGITGAAIDAQRDADMVRIEIPMSALHVTICLLVLNNGHKIVGVNTGSVWPENFDPKMAKNLARTHAIDQVWALLGYALRERLHTAH